MLDISLEEILIRIPVLLITVTVHELSHGYAAWLLGDPTAKNEGRLSLNPLKHLDPVGTIMIIFSRIGWAKPVPVNPAYFKNRKRGTILVSIAGPLSNLVMAFAGVLLYLVLFRIGLMEESIFMKFLLSFFITNISLAVFNLLPVPPLDGSRILSGVLPDKRYFGIMKYERYIGMVFLLVVLVFPDVLGEVLNYLIMPVLRGMIRCAEFVIGVFL
ncbi:MAG: site-2 protease family protein [Clostridiaceae bacterium]|nr:site-2 protease family protein [Clostridiaceae bacterium]